FPPNPEPAQENRERRIGRSPLLHTKPNTTHPAAGERVWIAVVTSSSVLFNRTRKQKPAPIASVASQPMMSAIPAAASREDHVVVRMTARGPTFTAYPVLFGDTAFSQGVSPRRLTRPHSRLSGQRE